MGEMIERLAQEQGERPRRTAVNGVIEETRGDSVKDWPKAVKMDMCWRVPQDNQRVMIFEKLEYTVESFEADRKKRARFADSSNPQRDQDLNEVHSDHIKTLYKQIK